MTAPNLVPTLALTLAQCHRAAAPAQPWSEAAFAKLLEQGAVAIGDARAFALGRAAADEAELLMIATHPDHRRQGLARRHLAALETRLMDQGAARMFLEVAADNVAAQALYAAAGYAVVGKRPGYYRRETERMDALLYAKPLT